MREIEFRGKLTNNRGWAFGNLNIHTDDCVIMTPDGTPLGRYGKVEPETVGQYTGLKDKNGKKIFEGDIVKCVSEDFEESVGQGVFEVVFETRNKTAYFGIKKDGKNTYGFNFDFTPANKCEVIGNIYDNPELLEVEKNNETND